MARKLPPPLRTPQYDAQGNRSWPWIVYDRQVEQQAIASPLQFPAGVTPAGVMDGVNAVFTLPSIPVAGQTFFLFKNGQKLSSGTAFTLVNNVITMSIAPVDYRPQNGDTFEAIY